MIDLRQLSQSTPLNQCWVSPRGYAWLPPHWPSPEYAVPPERLNEVLRAIIDAEPRITWGESSANGLRFDLIQRSRIFRFPDYISVEILPVRSERHAAIHSTLAIFSRSRYGRRDFGVNRQRVERWLAALDTQLERVRQAV